MGFARIYTTKFGAIYTICKCKDKDASNYFIVSQLNTYKEDVLQERKDREKAHYIKEEEIEKIRIEREELIANHDEDIKRIQENYQTQLNTYSRKVSYTFIIT